MLTVRIGRCGRRRYGAQSCNHGQVLAHPGVAIVAAGSCDFSGTDSSDRGPAPRLAGFPVGVSDLFDGRCDSQIVKARLELVYDRGVGDELQCALEITDLPFVEGYIERPE